MSDFFKSIAGIFLLLFLGLALLGQVVATQVLGWILVFFVFPFIVLAELWGSAVFVFSWLKKRLQKVSII